MDNNNKKKAELLGMPHGTASARLRKLILFDLIQRLKLDICFQCGQKIESSGDLSIEHKVAWQSAENPVESFFDLNNISFSHLSCNIGASDKANVFKALMRKVPDGYSYCFSCKQILPVNKFWNDASRLCGKQYRCKDCLRKYRKSRR